MGTALQVPYAQGEAYYNAIIAVVAFLTDRNMASRKQIRTAVLAGLGILFLGLLYASSQLSPGALPLTPAERRAQEMAQELEARRVGASAARLVLDHPSSACPRPLSPLITCLFEFNKRW